MSNRYVSTSDSDEWKNKYLESLEKLEASEENYDHKINLLRRGLVRVSLAADGVDPALDHLMNELRDLLRTSQAIEDLEPLLENIEIAVRQLDEEKEKCHDELLQSFESLAQQLSLLEVPRRTKSKIKKFSASVADALQEERKHGQLLNEYCLIQAESFESLRDTLEKLKQEKRNDSIFKKWLHKDAEKESEKEIHPDEEDAELGSAELEDITAAPKIEPEQNNLSVERNLEQRPLSRHVKDFAENLLESYEGEAVRERVGGVMLTLLDQLVIPADLKEREQSIRQKICEGIRWPQVPNTLSEAVSLVSRSQLELQKETTLFLHDLSGRLVDIEKFLVLNEQVTSDRNTNSNQLADTVNEHIQSIHANLEQFHNVTDLKQSIHQQINFISEAMDRYKRKERSIVSDSDKEIRFLKQRLDALEQESNRLKASIEEQGEKAYIDPLTEIPNRLAYEKRGTEEHSRWQRYGAPLSLAVADIDFFKQVNDRYGHIAGDKVLKVIAKLLAEGLREADFICRYGGEEFVIIFPETQGDDAFDVLEKVREKIASCPFHFKKNPVQITVSFGVSQFNQGDNLITVFKRADKALYEAKGGGRNKVVMA